MNVASEQFLHAKDYLQMLGYLPFDALGIILYSIVCIYNMAFSLHLFHSLWILLLCL